jgi:hypothetical protein
VTWTAHLAFAAAAGLFGCASPALRAPRTVRPIEEHQAIAVIARAYRDKGEKAVEGRNMRLPSGKVLRVDVGTAGHKYGIAFLTGGDRALLDPSTDLPARVPGRDLLVVQGAGADADAVVLLLFDEDYQDDDLTSERQKTAANAADKKLARDVEDFLLQARYHQLP